MKVVRIAALAVALAALLAVALTGCGKKKVGANDLLLPTPTGEDVVAVTLQPASPPKAEVLQTVAYYFADIGGLSTVYGAAEVKNTGSVPITISSAEFSFDVDGKPLSKIMQPVFWEKDVILPGETAHLCLWTSYEAKIANTGNITLTVTAEPAKAEVSKDLVLANLRVIQNLPGFATLSGMVENRSKAVDYRYSANYVAFYDAQDKLLGVWYFTKDASLPADEHRDFVMHMNSLPIPGLADNCAKIVGRSIGVE